jgi:hypothetical protein
MDDKVWRQYHYRPDEIRTVLWNWLGEDTFMIQNTVYRPQRRIENIRQLRCLFVDIDDYRYNAQQLLGRVQIDILNFCELPNPNLVIYSGRGINLIWFIEPSPFAALPLWQAVENEFARRLKSYGVDQKATDAVRVFRLAGSVNSKNGATVTIEHRHDYRYHLRDLQHEYLPELSPGTSKKKGRPAKIVHLYNVYSLHAARLYDLVRLIEIRDGNMDRCREITLFLYRYWSCCLLADSEEALRQTLGLNQELKHPLSEREVTNATKRAEKAWRAKNDELANRVAKERGFPGAGYNVNNLKLIEWLKIIENEQRQMTSITVTGKRVHQEANLSGDGDPFQYSQELF